MPHIAIMTAANVASDTPNRRADAYLFDEQMAILRKGFSSAGLTVEPMVWTRAPDWRRFSAVLVMCAWDYQDRHEEFLRALDDVAGAGIRVFNEPALVRWNIRKTYLRDLESRGALTIPTQWLDAPTGADVRAAMAAFGTDDVILKRQVGAGALGQVRYTRDNPPPDGPVLDRPGMVQPFIPAIATEGEISFLFVDGQFSHALVKRAAPGDYRIQEAYGGRSEPYTSSPADRAQARAVFDALDKPPLYARVDMLRNADGRLLLMELEVIEPFLYPAQGPHIGAMLGRALRKRIA